MAHGDYNDQLINVDSFICAPLVVEFPVNHLLMSYIIV
jgi:hypothetical protein